MNKKYRLLVTKRSIKNLNNLETIFEESILDCEVIINEDTTVRSLANSLNTLDLKENDFLEYKDMYSDNYNIIFDLDFYYDDGVLYPDFDPFDIKIFDFERYGFALNSTIKIVRNEVGGLGSAGGIVDEFVELYKLLNKFISENPLTLIIISPLFKKFVKKFVQILKNNLIKYSTFNKGLLFNDAYTLDSFTKAFRLEDLRMEFSEDYRTFVNALLIVYGYKYDYKNDCWLKQK
ncbi:hypothetical protein HF861_03595 [Faecalicoccus pleomorphus]|uniref:Uncharacterized protein n=1 Tax=Faecalicoccus pleomorphus TaxID=1323 RepID=A0A7X9NGT7_9FIRM|nr:hypothetical protein [Faecalicoccus pleomorphus]NME43965.1 hypothetical protein [Faecalicoccus pleomorphus]